MTPSSLQPVAGTHALPLYGREASRRIEQVALGAAQPHALMRRAGASVARLALAAAPHARAVWIAAGPGNNGGDGLEAAIHLVHAGRRVVVTLLGEADKQPADARDALSRAQDAGVAIQPALPQADDFDLAIDALLGVGATRAPQGMLAQAIGRLNAGRAPVVAVDLPSGLHADTGQALGTTAVHARHTLSLLTLKPGLFTGAGRDHAGRVWLDTLGVVPTDAPDAQLGAPDALRAVMRPRPHASHKGRYGDVLVIGGAAGMSGAALLAGRAALALGAGRVFVSMLAQGTPAHDAGHPELMVRPLAWAVEPSTLSASVVICGCGGGADIVAALPGVLHHAAKVVLDADALNAIAADPALAQRVRARAARGQPTIVTPHPLEAARLLGTTPADVQGDRVACATALAAHLQSCVVLKGSGTVVAAPGSAPRINPTGNALLASAGTGDVLAGATGALCGIAGDAAAIDVASAAAWLHGAAADAAAAAGAATPLTAGRLIAAMCRAASAFAAA